MKRLPRTLNIALLFLIVIFAVSQKVNATIININSLSNNESNPISVHFDAGIYDVSVIGVGDGGAYNSWNAWNGGQVFGCDGGGANCRVGWINNYYISSLEFGEMFLSDGVRYANSSLALANAIPTSFTLTSSAFVNFYIRDGVNGNLAWDNVGGMSLGINLPKSVPAPPVLLLLLVGLVAILSIGKRNRWLKS